MNNADSVRNYICAFKRLLEIDKQQALMADVQAHQILQYVTDINQPLMVLDIGCGDGFVIHLLSQALPNAAITGIDHSKEHIEFAKELTPEQQFITRTYTESADLKDSFELVYSSLTLHHIKELSYQDFVRTMSSYIHPEGTGIILEINPWNVSARRAFKNNPEEVDSNLIWPWQLKNMVTPYGIESHLTFYHIFTNSPHWFNEIEPLLSWMPLGQLYAVSWVKKELPLDGQ